MYSKIHSRLNWFFSYIGEPEVEEDIVLGDMNFDGNLDVTDVIQVINVILNVGDFTDNQLIAADYNSDGINNILDVSISIYSCCGCFRPPFGGTRAIVPSIIFKSAC